jgi:putative ABC transport system substrate-binding protein
MVLIKSKRPKKPRRRRAAGSKIYILTERKYKPMKAKILLISVIISVILVAGCSQQQTQKVYHVGILSGLDAFADTAVGFKTRMTELGYVEGKNVIYDLQKTNADPAAEQRILKKFVDDKVDLIFTFPTEPAVEAKTATQGTGIPVVFANAGIEGNNLVDSVRQPGGNITGVRFPASELTVQRMELLHEMVPEARRIYITYDSNYPGISFTVNALRNAAPAMNITLVDVPVTSMEELNSDLQMRANSSDIGMDAILIMPTLLTAGPDGFAVINEFATAHKLAEGGSLNYNADIGAVFSYIPQNADMGKLAAPLADKILKGTPAGTIPVVTPEAYLRINYKLAQELGLNVSEGLLARANEIIR